jgi:hypothetical protein
MRASGGSGCRTRQRPAQSLGEALVHGNKLLSRPPADTSVLALVALVTQLASARPGTVLRHGATQLNLAPLISLTAARTARLMSPSPGSETSHNNSAMRCRKTPRSRGRSGRAASITCAIWRSVNASGRAIEPNTEECAVLSDHSIASKSSGCLSVEIAGPPRGRSRDEPALLPLGRKHSFPWRAAGVFRMRDHSAWSPSRRSTHARLSGARPDAVRKTRTRTSLT